MLLCTDVFEDLARQEARARGLSEPRLVAIPHPIGGMSLNSVATKADLAYAEVVALLLGDTETADAGARDSDTETSEQGPSTGARRREVPADPAAFFDLAVRERWSDGLPLILPTPAAVEAMLRFTDRAPDEELGVIPPVRGVATVEVLAANAVMAGCRPEYFPIVLTAVEALLDPTFNLSAVQATTHPCGVLVLVSGPLSTALEINAESNAFGPGARANATIGRAIRLILINVGGAIPGDLDKATLGQPGKFGMCIAENEAASPWEPWRVALGYGSEVTTVTVHAGEAPHNIQDHDAQKPDALLTVVADASSGLGTNHYTLGGELLVILGPEHAAAIAAGGFSRADVQVELHRRMQRPVATVPEERLGAIVRKRYGGDTARLANGVVPMLDTPRQVLLVVAGGAGRHSMCVPSFGNTRAVTRVVAHRDGSSMLGIQAQETRSVLLEPAEIDRALAPLRETLRADGYTLTLRSSRQHGIVVAVEALDDACGECLVPKAVVERIVRERLGERGYSRGATIEVEYPGDSSTTGTP